MAALKAEASKQVDHDLDDVQTSTLFLAIPGLRGKSRFRFIDKNEFSRVKIHKYQQRSRGK